MTSLATINGKNPPRKMATSYSCDLAIDEVWTCDSSRCRQCFFPCTIRTFSQRRSKRQRTVFLLERDYWPAQQRGHDHHCAGVAVAWRARFSATARSAQSPWQGAETVCRSTMLDERSSWLHSKGGQLSRQNCGLNCADSNSRQFLRI